jgi:Domain of unknown function (DUF4349)
MRTAPAFWLILGLTTIACNERSRPPESPAANRPAAAPISRTAALDAVRRRAQASGITGEAVASDAAPSDQFSANSIPLGPIDDPAAMIIRTGTASIQIDSLEPALAAVRALAARVGGYVANTAVQAGNIQYRQATLEVKAPAGRFDDLVAGLQPLGKVETVNVTAEDVGEEFVDVSARVANSRRLENRLIDLLATRTGRLQDVMSVERELARVREEIERYEGRLRYLRSRTAMSTLSITIHEPLPVVGDPGSNILARAFERAWRNFMELLAGFIASLGVLVPVVLAGGAAAWGLRRRRRPATA